MIEDLAVLTNEKTHVTRNKYFCDNIDTKSISESLNKHFKVGLFVRKSNIERHNMLGLKKKSNLNHVNIVLISLLIQNCTTRIPENTIPYAVLYL